MTNNEKSTKLNAIEDVVSGKFVDLILIVRMLEYVGSKEIRKYDDNDKEKKET